MIRGVLTSLGLILHSLFFCSFSDFIMIKTQVDSNDSKFSIVQDKHSPEYRLSRILFLHGKLFNGEKYINTNNELGQLIQSERLIIAPNYPQLEGLNESERQSALLNWSKSHEDERESYLVFLEKYLRTH